MLHRKCFLLGISPTCRNKCTWSWTTNERRSSIILPRFLLAPLDSRNTFGAPYLWSYSLTLGPRLEREECWLTVWSGSCFTLGWAASSVFFLSFFFQHWWLFFRLKRAVWSRVCTVGGRRLGPVTLRCFVQPVKVLILLANQMHWRGSPHHHSPPPPHVLAHPGASLEVVVTAWRATAKSRACSPTLLRPALKSTWPT